jgi:hypothetical protein
MFGIGRILKVHVQMAVGRVSLPETLGTPEVGQAGVHAHTGTGSYNQPFSTLYPSGSGAKVGLG